MQRLIFRTFVVTLVTVGAVGVAQAAGVSGQGTWETTLQGRDLDGNLDNGAEAFYDTALNVTWLKDTKYAFGTPYDSIDGATDGRMRWVNAVAWADSLSFYDGVLQVTYDGWRLPIAGPVNGTSTNFGDSTYDGSTDYSHNISAPNSAFPGSKGSEMAYLFYNELGNKSYCAVSASCLPAPPQPGWGLVNTGPFSDLSGVYWSGAELPPGVGTDAAVFFVFSSDAQVGIWDSDVGGQLAFSKDGRIHAWAVHDGDVGSPIPEPETYALMLAGLGVLGVAVRRQRCSTIYSTGGLL